MRRFLFILSILFLPVFTVLAQQYMADRHISIENGLSNNFIQDIVIDGHGFAWVATESGLNRIAGETITVFRTQNGNGGYIIGNEIRALYYEPLTDKVLIGTEKGLSIYDYSSGSFHQITIQDGLNFSVINDIVWAGDRQVWLILAKDGVQKLNCDTYEFSSIEYFIKDIRSGLDDGNGMLYLGHQLRDGLTVINLKNKQTRNYRHIEGDDNSLPGNNVRCIYQDHLKNVWVGTNMGLALFDPKNGKFKKVIHESTNSDDNVFDVIEMDSGELWVASDMGGIHIVDLKKLSDQDVITYSKEVLITLSSINTRSIVRDSFGNIWIGNYSTGVDFISAHKSQFHTLPFYDKNHQPKRTYGLTSDKNGNVWLGGEDELTMCKNGKAINHWSITHAMNRTHSFVMNLMADSKGSIWMGVEDDGVIKLNPSSNLMERIGIGHPVSDIRTLYEDRDGNVWIGSEFGVFLWQNGRVSRPKLENDTLGHAVVFGMAEIGEQMLMGTNTGGLYIFNRSKNLIQRLTRNNGLPSNNINDILYDGENGIWLATFEGLAYISDINQPYQIEVFNEKQGLSDPHIRAILQDRSGRIWLSTYSGISCYDPQKKQFYNYNHFDNLPSGSFVAGSATLLPDGTMYFGSPTGVCYFNPQLMNNEQQVSEIQIVACEAYKPTGEDTEILNLTPDEKRCVYTNYEQNTLRITFTVKDYAQTGSVEYSYMMKGLNDQWYYIGNDHDVAFRGLQPGNYTFILRAKLKNQDWTQASTTQFEIFITPPFWRTWWAYLIYLLATGIAVWYFIRSYKHKLILENSLELERQENLQKQELNEERLRFFTNVTHELRTPLTLILGPLEDLVSDKQLPEVYHKKVELINMSAGRLRDLINQILEFRKTETQNRRLTVAKGDLGALVKEIGEYFKQLNRNSKVKVHVIVHPDIPPVYFDSEVITTILNNLLSNAVKYTPEGSINLIMDTDNKELVQISVTDTGYGIASDALPHIFDRYYQAKGKHQASGTGIGLALVKSLADLHEGTLTVESELGKGSKFTFTLMMDNSYPSALHKEDKESEKGNAKSEETVADDEDGTATVDEVRPLLLVVEDNDDIRQYIADSMGDDYRIIQATDGQEGKTLATEQIPDIIVSDIMMPKMDGIEMTKKLKEDVRTSHIPIILLTAKDSIEDKEEGYDSGADSYLTKPFSARLLQSRIQNLLAMRRRLAELINFRNTDSVEPITVAEDNKPILNSLDQAFIDRLNKTIEENITKEDLDMEFMTDKMAMSHSTFYRKVKALTGMSAKEYIRKLRLQRCAQLLRSGDYNVTEAAIMTGFNDLGHFREVFKKEFGVPPSEYMKRSS